MKPRNSVRNRVSTLSRRMARPALAAALVMGVTTAASAFTGVWWTPWTSEESPPATCADDTVLSGLFCSGSFCDSNRGVCRNTSRELQNHYWTEYKSEETPYNLCSAGYYVTGFDCRGSFCDDKSLECTRLEGAGHGSCRYVGPFSEEGSAGVQCPAGQLVAGTFCSGAYCDNQYLYCCTP